MANSNPPPSSPKAGQAPTGRLGELRELLQSRLLRFTGAYALLGFLPMGINFLFLPVYTRYLRPAEYGIVALCNVCQTFATVFLALGIDAAYSRFYFEHNQNEESKRNLLTTALAINLGLLGVVCAVASVAGQQVFDLLLKGLSFRKFGWYAILAAEAQMIAAIVFSFYRNEERIWGAMGATALPAIGATMGTVFAVVISKAGAQGAVAGKCLGTAAATLPFLLYLGVFRGGKLLPGAAKAMMKFGLPLVFFTFGTYVLFNFDRVLMRRQFGLETLGIYALGAAMTTPLEVVLQAVQRAVQPVFYRRLQAKDPGIAFQIGSTYVGISAAILVALGALQLLAEPVLQAIKGDKYVAAAFYLPMLGVSQLFRVRFTAYTFSLIYSKKTAPLPISTFVALGVGAAVVYPLQRVFGALGIPMAVLAWKIAQQGFVHWLSHRSSELRIKMGGANGHLLAGAIWAATFYFAPKLLPAHEGVLRPAACIGVMLWGLASLAATYRHYRDHRPPAQPETVEVFLSPGGRDQEPRQLNIASGRLLTIKNRLRVGVGSLT